MLDAGLASLRLTLAADARRAIDDHVRLLLAWTTAINLTAIREPAAVARLHVLDSLSAVPLLRALGAKAVLDLGSGGGFPGLPLAAALPAEALLVDSIAKKTRFLETAVQLTGLAGSVGVARSRVEDLGRDPVHAGRWPVVAARAVGPLANLVELAMPLLTPGGTLVAWKRGDLTDELTDARRVMPAHGAVALSVTPVTVDGLESHRLVVIRREGRSPPGR